MLVCSTALLLCYLETGLFVLCSDFCNRISQSEEAVFLIFVVVVPLLCCFVFIPFRTVIVIVIVIDVFGAGRGSLSTRLIFVFLSERAARVRFHGDGPLLGVQGAGKAMEVFRIRSEAQSKKKMKR